MWDQTTDKMFLKLREDAVMLFEKQSLTLMYLNESAKRLFSDAEQGIKLADLIPIPAVNALAETAAASDSLRPFPLPLERVPWFPERAMLHAVPLEWDGKSAVALTIDRRAYGPPAEAMQLMKAVLSASYFTAVRIDMRSKRCSIISDKNLLLDTQALFGSFADYIALYAEAVIHPEDRQQFISSFTAEQFRLFIEANTKPVCTVRRLQDEEYRWASFTLASVDPNIVLLLGKDSNEQHLEQERSDHYRTQLETLSLRNQYILSNVSGIFRLTLHIDLRTGETTICSMADSFHSAFSYDKTYSYPEVAEKLISLVHPDDKAQFTQFMTLNAFFNLNINGNKRAEFEYRRITPHSDPDASAQYTRSIITLEDYENGKPTSAFYAVLDIDEQKRAALSAKRRQEALTTQFNELVKNRFIRFTVCDYATQTARYYRIVNQKVMEPVLIPFGQYFERLIMPQVHPEDFKRVAMAFLPQAAGDAYKAGKRQIVIDYRTKFGEGWHYVRGEMYLRADDLGNLQSVLYVADIDDEVQSRNRQTVTEHEQLILRRKFGQIVQDSYIRIGEVDPDADTISHYQLLDGDYVLKKEDSPFSQYSEAVAKRIHPSQKDDFNEKLSFRQVRRAARERVGQLKGLYLFDAAGNGQYLWCNIGVRFFTNENGKAYYMTFVQNVNEEICGKNTQLNALAQAKQQLQELIRSKEQARIQKAHVFMNITSNFQLSLNQIYSALDRMKQAFPQEEVKSSEFQSIVAAYENLSAMNESAKDVLLVENNQLPLLKEPTNLVDLIRKLKESSSSVFYKKNLHFSSDASGVTQETVLCDRRRITFLLENIFMKIIRALPEESSCALRLSQKNDVRGSNRAIYEFALMTREEQIAKDIKDDFINAAPKKDTLRLMQDALTSQDGNHQQHNIYLSKRLIALMDGSLDYVKLPGETSAVILHLPMEFVPTQVIFPHSRCFGKRAIVMDSRKTAAMSELEMLRETGMQTEWQAAFNGLTAYLQLAQKENRPYDLVLLRQSELNRCMADCFKELGELIPETPLLIVLDVPAEEHAKPTPKNKVFFMPSPMFRSGLADVLYKIFDH